MEIEGEIEGGQVLMFGSILPISLQQIEYGKILAVHLNGVAKSYTFKPMTIYIDTYLGAKL